MAHPADTRSVMGSEPQREGCCRGHSARSREVSGPPLGLLAEYTPGHACKETLTPGKELSERNWQKIAVGVHTGAAVMQAPRDTSLRIIKPFSDPLSPPKPERHKTVLCLKEILAPRGHRTTSWLQATNRRVD